MPTRHPIDSPLAVPAAIVLGSIIIAGAIITSVKSLGQFSQATSISAPSQAVQQAAQRPTAPAVDAAKVNVAGEPSIGSPSAPVTIAYWYDYQCPFCKQNEENVMPQLIKDYINTGKARIIFKDFQFLGQDSLTIGKVARAVWETSPSKFYAWHKGIFDAQGQENSGWATPDKIRSVTADIFGADVADQILALAEKNSASYQKEIDADKSEAASFGISATPSFVINKTLLIGARPYESFKSIIDTAISGK